MVMTKLKRKTYILAEMAASYEGDPKIAEFIIVAAAKAKADGILFQMRDLETYIVPSDEAYEETKSLCLSREDWLKLIEKAISLDLDVWANVYDLESARLCKDRKVKGFKFHSSVLENEDLVREVIEFKKPLLLSIGGMEREEIEKVLKLVYSINQKAEIYLMYGLQNFPTNPEGVNLNFIKELSEDLKIPFGYQDHSEPLSSASAYMSILFVAQGAAIIEKHITHNRSLKGIDYQAALDPDEFIDFVKDIRTIDDIFNKKPGEVSPDELVYREYKTLMKVVAIKDIKAGEKFTKDNIAVMRAKKGEIKGKRLKLLLNKDAEQSYKKFEPIKRNELLKVGIFITARLKSKRLPYKVIKLISGKTMIEWLVDRLKHCNIEPIIATSTNPQDDPLVEIAKKNKIDYFRGSEDDVLVRIRDCARKFDIDLVISITADNPFAEPIFIEKMIERYLDTNFDFCEIEESPLGCGSYGGIYAVTKSTLEKVCEIKDSSDTEIWGSFIKDPGKFKCDVIKVKDPNILRPEYRVTVDTQEDFDLVTKIFEILLKDKEYFNIYDICSLLDKRQDLVKINTDIDHWTKLSKKTGE